MKADFYKTIIEPAEEGGYTAYVPTLPGCVSEGETYEETLDEIGEALTPTEIAAVLERMGHGFVRQGGSRFFYE